MCKRCDLCWQRDIGQGRVSPVPLGHLGGRASLSPFLRGAFVTLQARRCEPCRQVMEEHPCTHKPPPPSSSRRKHRPARSDWLVPFSRAGPLDLGESLTSPGSPRGSRADMGRARPGEQRCSLASPGNRRGPACSARKETARPVCESESGPAAAAQPGPEPRRGTTAPVLPVPPEVRDAAAGEGTAGAELHGVSSSAPAAPAPRTCGMRLAWGVRGWWTHTPRAAPGARV